LRRVRRGRRPWGGKMGKACNEGVNMIKVHYIHCEHDIMNPLFCKVKKHFEFFLGKWTMMCDLGKKERKMRSFRYFLFWVLVIFLWMLRIVTMKHKLLCGLMLLFNKMIRYIVFGNYICYYMINVHLNLIELKVKHKSNIKSTVLTLHKVNA
jgi:hypothetical protein